MGLPKTRFCTLAEVAERWNSREETLLQWAEANMFSLWVVREFRAAVRPLSKEKERKEDVVFGWMKIVPDVINKLVVSPIATCWVFLSENEDEVYSPAFGGDDDQKTATEHFNLLADEVFTINRSEIYIENEEVASMEEEYPTLLGVNANRKGPDPAKTNIDIIGGLLALLKNTGVYNSDDDIKNALIGLGFKNVTGFSKTTLLARFALAKKEISK